ncbi:MAG: carboxyl transferase domain-containing protein, partial [Acidimicrobiia bacterium]
IRIVSPLLGTVVSVRVSVGDTVAAGEELCVIESMKMEHAVCAEHDLVVRSVAVAAGDKVENGQLLVDADAADSGRDSAKQADVTSARDASRLAALRERKQKLTDDARPAAAQKRHSRGMRTVRENIADLFDQGTFVEYGGFAVAAQRRRRETQDLIDNTPADGLVTGIGLVDGRRCAMLAYDYTVLAGTQGFVNHRKTDRILDVIERERLPVVLYAEGGGGRPGDVDAPGVAGLDVKSFASFARLSGLVPTVGIVAGYCFAGNAALLGCCDVIIAAENANIGMAGPAMIEGGGLGVVSPRDIGPASVQRANGVVDVVVADESQATRVAKRYLEYFAVRVVETSDTSPRVELRDVIPAQRTRVYDMRRVVDALVDQDSLLELRRDFALGAVTALARVHGRAVGVIANIPAHLGGAIDADAADKFSRFVQLCDAHDLPIVSLCDTPGFMVGPEAERSAQVRHFARLFVTAASITVPWITVVVRKGYGLGAQAMAAGSFHAATTTIAWPTGEFGGMGLEGAVRLGYRKELEAAPDEAARSELEQRLVAAAYEQGSALNMAMHIEIDDVIDPADTPARIAAILQACAPVPPRIGKKRPMIDTW